MTSVSSKKKAGKKEKHAKHKVASAIAELTPVDKNIGSAKTLKSEVKKKVKKGKKNLKKIKSKSKDKLKKIGKKSLQKIKKATKKIKKTTDKAILSKVKIQQISNQIDRIRKSISERKSAGLPAKNMQRLRTRLKSAMENLKKERENLIMINGKIKKQRVKLKKLKSKK